MVSKYFMNISFNIYFSRTLNQITRIRTASRLYLCDDKDVAKKKNESKIFNHIIKKFAISSEYLCKF